MYTAEDFRSAQKHVRKWYVVFGCVLGIMLILYVAAICAGMRWGMLAVLMAALLFAVFCGDLYLLPALRCRRFLQEMQVGLRRSVECSVDVCRDELQLQDGLRVLAQQVLLEGGDTRIFYLNVDHRDRFPGKGCRIRLESYGRHITGYEILAGEE